MIFANLQVKQALEQKSECGVGLFQLCANWSQLNYNIYKCLHSCCAGLLLLFSVMKNRWSSVLQAQGRESFASVKNMECITFLCSVINSNM